MYHTDIIILIISHRYTNTITHDTSYVFFMFHWYTDSIDTRIHQFTEYRHHRYLDTLYIVISCSSITVTSIYWYTCMYCFYILVIWITIHSTCIIVACISVNQCNSNIRTWYNYVRSIQVTMIMVSSELVYPCISGTWRRHNWCHV